MALPPDPNVAYSVTSTWVRFVGLLNNVLFIEFNNGDCALYPGRGNVEMNLLLAAASKGRWVNFFPKFSGWPYQKIASPVPIIMGALDFEIDAIWTATTTLARVEAWGRGGASAGQTSGGGGAYAFVMHNSFIVGQNYDITVAAIGMQLLDAGLAIIQAAHAVGDVGGNIADSIGSTKYNGGNGKAGNGNLGGGGGACASESGNGQHGSEFCIGAPAGYQAGSGGNGGLANQPGSNGGNPGGGAGASGAGNASTFTGGAPRLRIFPLPVDLPNAVPS